jgi:dipeptidyl aminopeptidase/acylaminoacyl peptidase
MVLFLKRIARMGLLDFLIWEKFVVMRVLLYLFLCFAVKFTFAQELEQFISYPIESNFATSANGKNIAWVINDHGKRNVMVRLGADFPKIFTDYQKDDGQEVSQLVFSPNGTKLVFVRGRGTDRFIFVKDVSSKNPAARITQGTNPLFFPDGLGILFSKGGQIYETNLDINSSPKLLFIASGRNIDPKFSPNGNEILFTSDRDDHSFIGIYNLTSKKIRWSTSDVTNDKLAVWSPDGKQIAFIRTEGSQSGGPTNFSKGEKFSIWVANAATLTEKMIWQSPADDGGFAQQTVKPLTWTSSNRILFFSEHTGWNHLFSMNPDGSDVKDITPGDGEVENFILDASGQNIFFDGNREDLDRRHIWKSGITIGNPKAVTIGEGIETDPHLSGENLFCFRSTFNSSKSLVRADEYRKITLPVNPPKLTTFSNSYFVKPEKVTFQSADGATLYGQLFIDRKISGKRAAIIYIHSGPHRQMLSGFHFMEYSIFTYAFSQYLASMGYAVLSVNYRDGIGYGKDFRIANKVPKGEGQYKDIVAAAKFLQIIPEVDRTKIGLWGGSYGGYLTTMGLARNPEIFKAGATLHCAVDWTFDNHDSYNGWGITKLESAFTNKTSPVSDFSKWTAPLFILQGNDSTTSEFQMATDLVKRLREKKVSVELLSLPNDIHFNLRYEDWAKTFYAVKEFFDRKLK